VAPDESVYYEALLSGAWILTWDWIEASTAGGGLQDEVAFLSIFIKKKS
jgi:hypothetical protein